MKKVIERLKKEWYWYGTGWVDEDKEGRIYGTSRWYNLPRRFVGFVWVFYLSSLVCRLLGHAWMTSEDCDGAFCRRCGVDTEIEYCE